MHDRYAKNKKSIEKLSQAIANLNEQRKEVKAEISKMPFGYPIKKYSGKLGGITRRIQVREKAMADYKRENELILFNPRAVRNK